MDRSEEIQIQPPKENLVDTTFNFDLFPVPEEGYRFDNVTLKKEIGGGHLSTVYQADLAQGKQKPVAVKLYRKGNEAYARAQIDNMKGLFEAAERIGVTKIAVPALLGYSEPIPGISAPDKRFAVVMELLDLDNYSQAWRIKDKVPGGVVPLVDIIDTAVIFLDTIRVMHEAGRAWSFGDRKIDDVHMAFTPSGFDVKITDWDVQAGFSNISGKPVDITKQKEDDAAIAIKTLGGLLEVMVVPSGYMYAREYSWGHLDPLDLYDYLTRHGISDSKRRTGSDVLFAQYRKALSNGTSLILEHQSQGGLAIGELARKMAQGDQTMGGVLSLEVAKAEFLQTAVTIMDEGQRLFGKKSNTELPDILKLVRGVMADYWKSEEGVASKYDNYWKGRRLPKKIPYSIPENFPREYAKGFIEGDLSSLYRLEAQLVMEMWRRRGGIDGHIDYKAAYKTALDDALQKHQWTSQELEEEWEKEDESEKSRSEKFREISNRLLHDLIDYSREKENKPTDQISQ